jgi:hypothetical protein
MSIDRAWFDKLRAMSDLPERDTLDIDGVEIELPKANARGRDRLRDWQRRILTDLIPDSVNADAPERTPFRLLYALTTGQSTRVSMDEAFAGELGPLEEVFRAQTVTGQKKMTLAFHVLAVKAANKKESEAKGFTERTLILLCRKEDGALDVDLLRELVEQFRRSPSELDLAQRTLLDKLHEGWTPKHEPTFDLPDLARVPEVPFDPSATSLFREDLRSLLGAQLPPTDFFQMLNLLLIVHLGLYQPRVATLLNPQMESLFREMERPNERNLRDLDSDLRRFAHAHPFHRMLACRAPDPDLRAITLHTPARVSFEELGTAMSVFHFNVLLLVQLRRLGEAWFAHRWDRLEEWRLGKLDPSIARELAARVKGPREFLEHMGEDPAYVAYLHKALLALAVRFVYHQITETDRNEALEELAGAPSALHGLRRLYERYNIQTSPNRANSRAYKQGIGVVSSMLRQGQYGLIQSRGRVGAYFEMGVGLLPLFLLLAVGPGREKVPVDRFWARLASYGLDFDAEEQEQLLARLRSMGVYERYSDAGEAAYVRNLLTTTKAA